MSSSSVHGSAGAGSAGSPVRGLLWALLKADSSANDHTETVYLSITNVESKGRSLSVGESLRGVCASATDRALFESAGLIATGSGTEPTLQLQGQGLEFFYLLSQQDFDQGDAGGASSPAARKMLRLTESTRLLHVGHYGELTTHPALARSAAKLPIQAEVEIYWLTAAEEKKDSAMASRRGEGGFHWHTVAQTDHDRQRATRGCIDAYSTNLFIHSTDASHLLTPGQSVLLPFSPESKAKLESAIFRLHQLHAPHGDHVAQEKARRARARFSEPFAPTAAADAPAVADPNLQHFLTLRSSSGCTVNCFDVGGEHFVPLEKEKEVWAGMLVQREKEIAQEAYLKANPPPPEPEPTEDNEEEEEQTIGDGFTAGGTGFTFGASTSASTVTTSTATPAFGSFGTEAASGGTGFSFGSTFAAAPVQVPAPIAPAAVAEPVVSSESGPPTAGEVVAAPAELATAAAPASGATQASAPAPATTRVVKKASSKVYQYIRKSTGGQAPRKQLATKSVRKRGGGGGGGGDDNEVTYAFDHSDVDRGTRDYRLRVALEKLPAKQVFAKANTFFVQWSRRHSDAHVLVQPYQQLVMLQLYEIKSDQLRSSHLEEFQTDAFLKGKETIPVFHDTAQTGYDDRALVCKVLGVADPTKPFAIDFDKDLVAANRLLFVQVANASNYAEFIEYGQAYLEQSILQNNAVNQTQTLKPDADPLAPKVDAEVAEPTFSPFVTLSPAERLKLSPTSLSEYYSVEDDIIEKDATIAYAETIEAQQQRATAWNQMYGSFKGTFAPGRFLQSESMRDSDAAQSIIPPLAALIDEYAADSSAVLSYQLYQNPHSRKQGAAGRKKEERSCGIPSNFRFFKNFWPMTEEEVAAETAAIELKKRAKAEAKLKAQAEAEAEAAADADAGDDAAGSESMFAGTRSKKGKKPSTGGFGFGARPDDDDEEDEDEDAAAASEQSDEEEELKAKTLLDLVLPNGVVAYMPHSLFYGIPLRTETLASLSDAETTFDPLEQDLVLMPSETYKTTSQWSPTSLEAMCDDKVAILKDKLKLITPAQAKTLTQDAAKTEPEASRMLINLKRIPFASDPAIGSAKYFLFISCPYPAQFVVNHALHSHYLIADRYDPRGLLKEFRQRRKTATLERHLGRVGVHEQQSRERWFQQTSRFMGIWTCNGEKKNADDDGGDDDEDEPDEDEDDDDGDGSGSGSDGDAAPKEKKHQLLPADSSDPRAYLVVANPFFSGDEGASYLSSGCFVEGEGQDGLVTASIYARADDLWGSKERDETKWTAAQKEHVQKMQDLRRACEKNQAAASVLDQARPWLKQASSSSAAGSSSVECDWVLVGVWVALMRQERNGFYCVSKKFAPRIESDVCTFCRLLDQQRDAEFMEWFRGCFDHREEEGPWAANEPGRVFYNRSRLSGHTATGIIENCFSSQRDSSQNFFYTSPAIATVSHQRVATELMLRTDDNGKLVGARFQARQRKDIREFLAQATQQREAAAKNWCERATDVLNWSAARSADFAPVQFRLLVDRVAVGGAGVRIRNGALGGVQPPHGLEYFTRQVSQPRAQAWLRDTGAVEVVAALYIDERAYNEPEAEKTASSVAPAVVEEEDEEEEEEEEDSESRSAARARVAAERAQLAPSNPAGPFSAQAGFVLLGVWIYAAQTSDYSFVIRDGSVKPSWLKIMQQEREDDDDDEAEQPAGKHKNKNELAAAFRAQIKPYGVLFGCTQRSDFYIEQEDLLAPALE